MSGHGQFKQEANPGFLAHVDGSTAHSLRGLLPPRGGTQENTPKWSKQHQPVLRYELSETAFAAGFRQLPEIHDLLETHGGDEDICDRVRFVRYDRRHELP